MQRSTRVIIAAFAAVAGAHGELRAQYAARRSNPLLERLTGHWRMVGQVRGHPVTYDLDARRILNGAFVELHMKDVARPAQYEALVLIGEDTLPNRVLVHWLDSTGGAYSVPSGDGSTSGDTLTFDIPYPESPFHDTFVFRRSNGSWMFRLDGSDKNGGRRPFAEYEVKRK